MKINAAWVGLGILAAVLAGSAVQSGQADEHAAGAVCATCHVPHLAMPNNSPTSFGPLWNPVLASALPTFTVYASPTFDALNTGITQPDGYSKLCLCCHDGGYGAITPGHTFGDGKAMTLTESHPISFVYDSSLASNPKLLVKGELKDPAVALSGVTPTGTIITDLLDPSGKVQCTSCHDIHHGGIGPYFLRFNYTPDNGKTMCRTCHTK